MSLADTERAAESISRLLYTINSPVMHPPPLSQWPSSERKRVGEGVEKELGRRGGKGEGKRRDKLHI